MSSHDAVRARFAKTVELQAERADAQAAELANRLRRFVALTGEERALDVGTGVGGLAFALAPLVREVVAVDVVPELLDEARRRAGEHRNVAFAERDATDLGFESASFDLAATMRTLHHIHRPELAMAELVRVTRPGGTVLVIDQIAPADPLAAFELNRFERARDPTHERTLAEIDLRALFEANGLVLRRSEVVRERRELDPYLDLAGCEGEERERARAVAPGDAAYTVEVGWYLCAKPGLT